MVRIEAGKPAEELRPSHLTFQSCEEQLSSHRVRVREMKEQGLWSAGEKVVFDRHQNTFREMFQQVGYAVGQDTRIDLYNPSGEFPNPPNKYKALRAQPNRDATVKIDHFGSRVVFVKNVDGEWIPQRDPILKLEDPFVTIIDNEIYFGGVRLNLKNQNELEYWETVIHRGKTIPEMQKQEWIIGPRGMKDLRFLEQADGSIGWYTRPQGEIGGLGNIGYIEMSREDFNSLSSKEVRKRLEEAPLLHVHFPEGQWGGVNEAQAIKDEKSHYNGMNLLLAHQAMRDENGNRHYYPKAIVHDPKTGDIYDHGVIAERSDFPDGPARNDDISPYLTDVLFPASLTIIDNDWAEIVTGLSDREIATRKIRNPFNHSPRIYRFAQESSKQLAA